MTTMQAIKQLRRDFLRFSVLSVLILASGCFPSSHNPSPEPDSESIFSQTAKESYQIQAELLSEIFNQAATELREENITTELELHSYLKKEIAEKTGDSMLAIDQMIQGEINGEAFSINKAARVMGGIAEGFGTFKRKETR